jgi:hypothetical protein
MRIQILADGIRITGESGSMFVTWDVLSSNEWLAVCLIGAVS